MKSAPHRVGNPMAAGGSGAGSSAVTVSAAAANPSWQSTSVYLRIGEQIVITASGSVVHWKSKDGSEKQTCGPSGIEGTTNENVYLAPGLRRMALVGKVGRSVFYVGSGKTLQAPEAGTLYLGINDTVYAGGCADNEGFWSVEIWK